MRVSRATALAVVVAGTAAAGCGAPSRPTPAEPASPPSALVTAPTVAANAAPEVIGDELCVGPVGARHVYPLRLVDPDGDGLAVRAEAVEPRGEVHPRAISGLSSPAGIEIVYEPPPDRPDENVILLTVTDARGATTIRRLVARSG
jgi:hypothetical protein